METKPDVRLCLVGRIRAGLNNQDCSDLDYMIANPKSYSTRLIARVLTAHGQPVRKDAVHTHRLGDCSCP